MIDIFLSRPTWVDSSFESGLTAFVTRLTDLDLRPRTLGASDQPTRAPLDEVIGLLRQCRGALILGYPQIQVETGSVKGKALSKRILLSTEWNHIEAGLAYARELPLLVIHHKGVVRGIFDRGAISSFIYELNLADPAWALADKVSGALRKWRDDVLDRDGAARASAQRASGPTSRSAMDPASVLGTISSGLNLVDQFVDVVDKARGDVTREHSVQARQDGRDLTITVRGHEVERIAPDRLQLNTWDDARYKALELRVRANWQQFNGLYSQTPSLAPDERVRIEQRMEQMRKELCKDFREMIAIYEQTLGVGLADHYSLYNTCSDH